MRVAAPRAGLRRAADPAAEQLDQLLFGEVFDVVEVEGGAAWGQARRDGYVGYVDLAALSAQIIEPTHRVTAISSFAFAEPTIKSPAFGPLGMNALVRAGETKGSLVRLEGAGWAPATHLAPIGEAFIEPARAAEAFLHTPYLWGGRDSGGIDCSGLVQQALYAAGLACPRDSDQQARLGETVSETQLQRGDLVAWRGHIGMMLDEVRLIHANAHHMAVAIEPLAQARARIAAAGAGEPIAFRRPPMF
jgi:cell wall-associated NlpC family hydrolase